MSVRLLALWLVPGLLLACGTDRERSSNVSRHGAQLSLPSPSVGPRPGPAVLYQPLATAPQLENTGKWRAAPLMVSGADAYAGGEYLYQDYIYDSYGANTSDVAGDPPNNAPGDTSFGAPTGDVVYPTDVAKHGFNSADLLELRVRKPSSSTLEYRATLNTMLDADVAAVAIGIDSAPGGSDQWGFGLGSLGPLGLEHVIVVTGSGAWLDDQLLPTGSSAVDLGRHQLQVTVPLAPGQATWRHYAVVGLFNPGTGQFRQILDQPTATEPGGAHGTQPPPVFNVAFRFAEPRGQGLMCLGARGLSGCGHWNDHGQALALANRDISQFHADIDFQKISQHVLESHVPTSGFITRLFVSHLGLGEGARVQRPALLGRIQPYGLYVPTTYSPSTPAPLHIQLHWLSGTWMQYAVFTPNLYQQLGEQRGAIVLTPQGRGPDGWYHDEAEVDVFEAWADVAAHYSLAANRTTVAGYSMGGYGTYRLAALYPDLFSRGFPIVGPSDESIPNGASGGAQTGDGTLTMIDDALQMPGWAHLTDDESVMPIFDNVRNIALLIWNGSNDANVPVTGAELTQQRLQGLGYMHELDVFAGYDHFSFQSADQWGPGRDFLAAAGDTDLDPRRVTYRVKPVMDRPALGLVHDHAYWVGDIRADAGAITSLVDVYSSAKGKSDPTTEPIVGTGTDPSAHTKVGLRYLPPTPELAQNALTLRLESISSVALWPERGSIAPTFPMTVNVTSDSAATVIFRGSSFPDYPLAVPAGTSTHVITLSP